MKKTFALLLVAVASVATAFAQDKPQKGDIIYGTVSDDEGPLFRIIITEVNSNNRIISQTMTDENGYFSFRLVNPDNRLVFKYDSYLDVDIPVSQHQLDIKMIPRSMELMGTTAPYDIVFSHDLGPKDYYIPYRDQIHYGSIEELCNNLYLEF